MPLLTRTLTAAAALVAAFAVPAAAQSGGGGNPPGSTEPTPPPAPGPPPPRLVVGKPTKKTYIREGPRGRLLLGGRWYFRQDDALLGESNRYFAQRSLRNWKAIEVPYDWNGSDTTLNRSSIGWFRKEFRLPRSPRKRRLLWKVRFESVNHRATVWLNGRKIGSHAPGYFPFELDLAGLRKGRNRLVVEVSTLRGSTDLTHWRRAKFNGYGSGGWWNFGGISREVYVRPVDTVDVQDVAVIPRLRCVRCPARVEVRALVRNAGRKGRRVTLALAVNGAGSSRRIELSPRKIRGRSSRQVVTSFVIRRPRLWQPGRPSLYGLTVAAAVDGRRRASFVRYFGVRKIQRLADGRVLLNGRQLQLRGASVHEDDIATGAALTPGQRSLIVHRLRQLHATITRAHYPLHPALMEAFDRAGILYWSQAPVYQVPASNMANPTVRANAVQVVEDTVKRDLSHPSVLAWSVANELPDEEQPAQGRFITEAAAAVRRLDRTRLVAIDRQSQLGQPDPAPALRTLDAIGINDYFGWYSASLIAGHVSRSSDTGPFLDQQHSLYPGKALFVTEFGAESNHDGPATEKGTYAFQSKWLRDHLAIYATRPYLNGAIVWALRDFRVHPTWGGGNPKPNPPWNNKGLIDETGPLKPAFFAMQRLFRQTRPLR